MNKILVIGSSNTDLIAKVDRFPNEGETIEGRSFLQATGGKGANQALAAHKLGGNVKFITSLGKDANGQNTLKYYEAEDLDVSSSLIVNNVSTGTAMILVNKEGENCIVITPGANNELTPEYIMKVENDIGSADIVVLQMEIPYDAVRKVCQLANKHNTRILLNVAPARQVDTDLLKLVDILVVNETEIETISKKKIGSIGEEAVVNSLLLLGAKTVILTMGKRGCLVKNDSISQYIPAFHVETVDSTAAGDTFCGALVAQLSKGVELVEALKFATAASAICVTRMGAQPSIPTENEVNEFLESHVVLSENGSINKTG